MKKLIQVSFLSLFLLAATSCNTGNEGAQENNSKTSTEAQSNGAQNQMIDQQTPQQKRTQNSEDINPIQITTADFKDKIWDYENDPEAWAYKGDLPCVVDFYADWCKPCKRVAPIMDDLADYYAGRVQFYKVNTDDERELSTVFQISSIPAILFAPSEGKPAMQPGAMTKDDYIKIIDKFVLKIDDKSNDNSKLKS